VEINRIKVALAETRRKNKWLAAQIGKDESTIFRWCTNARQLFLANLLRVANALDSKLNLPKNLSKLFRVLV